MDDDFLGFRDKLTAFGGLGILSHLVGSEAHLLKRVGLDEDEVMGRGVRVVEIDSDRLVRLGWLG